MFPSPCFFVYTIKMVFSSQFSVPSSERTTTRQHCGWRWHGRVIMLSYSRVPFRFLMARVDGGFEPKVRSHEILQNLCAKVNDSSFMNVLWVIRAGGEHCCVRAFGVIRIQKDFHEDITPRGIHNQALHKSDKPSFSALQWLAKRFNIRPHDNYDCMWYERMKSVLKFIVAINPSSRIFRMTCNFSFVSRLVPTRFIVIGSRETRRCLALSRLG